MARIHWRKDKSITFLMVYEAQWSGVIKVMHKTHRFPQHSIIIGAVFMFHSFNWGRYGSTIWTTFWLKFEVDLVASHLCFTFFFYLGDLCTLVQHIPVWKCHSQILPLKALRVVSCWVLEVLSCYFFGGSCSVLLSKVIVLLNAIWYLLDDWYIWFLCNFSPSRLMKM